MRLDYHHWDYEIDVGCRLCRDCHEYIHEPEGARPSETPGEEWVEVVIERLVSRYSEHHSWLKPERILKQFSIPREYEQVVRQCLKRAECNQ